jgi:hypothetical protein
MTTRETLATPDTAQVASSTDRRHNLWILCGVFFLICLRTPRLLLYGRVFAEEGSTYLRYAWETGFVDALLAPHQGYYSLVPNLCTIIDARVLPLAEAALFLTWASLAIQLLTAWLALTCEAFPNLTSRAMAAVIVTVAAPSNETWLNTINSQFYLAICAGIILISTPSRLRNAVLVAAGLTGILSCLLTPFFWLGAYRNHARRAQTVIITVCTAVQISIMLHVGLRHAEHHPGYFAEAFLSKNVIFPYLGQIPARLASQFAIHHLSAFYVCTSFVLVALVLVFLYLRFSGTALLLCAMGVWVQIFSLWGAMNGGTELIRASAEPRYFLICNVFIGLAFVLLYGETKSRAALAAIALMTIAGLTDYGLRWRDLQSGPVWSREVMYWRQHPEQKFQTEPYGWPPFSLPPEHTDQHLPPDTFDNKR